MSNVRRVYVEKKEAYAVKAKELQEEIKSYLGITSVTGVRVLIRYDVENISEATYQRALVSVFSEPPVDDIYEETFDLKGAKAFSGISGLTSGMRQEQLLSLRMRTGGSTILNNLIKEFIKLNADCSKG